MNPLKELDIDDEKLLSKAAGEVVKILGLGPEAPIPDTLQLICLYDNLATILGGDEELMRHWMGEKNKHLGFEPRMQVHNEEHLCEMNGYLEGLRYH